MLELYISESQNLVYSPSTKIPIDLDTFHPKLTPAW